MWLWARDSNVSVTEKTFKPALLTPATASSGNPCIAGKTNLHGVLCSHLLLCLFCESLTCFFKLWDIGRQWHSVLSLYVIEVFLHYSMMVVFAHTRAALLRGERTLTDSLVSGVEKLCEGSGGSFCLDGLGCLLILSQLTQHTCSYTLDVLDRRIQQLQRKIEACQTGST